MCELNITKQNGQTTKNIPLDLAIRHLVMMPYNNVNGIVRNADVPNSLPIAIPGPGFDDEYPGH